MERLPLEILRLICVYARDHDSNDLATLRRVSRFWLQASTPLLFENLTIILSNDGDTQQLLSEFHDSGYGSPFLEHARTLDLVCLRDLSCFNQRRISKHLKNMRPNLFSHIPQVALRSFLEEYCLLGVTPVSPSEFHGWHWVFDAYWKEEWQPLVTLVSHLRCLARLNYGLLNRFPMPIHEAIARYHPECALNIWKGAMPLLDPPLDQQTFLNSNPLQDPLPRMDDYSLSNLRSYTALCPVKSKIVSPQIQWTHMTRHLSYLAACHHLRHLEIRPDDRWGTYDEVNRSNERWASIPPPEAIANLESLRVSDSSPCEQILVDLASVFALSTLRSLDFDVYEHPDLLRDLAPRLPNLQRLFISMDTYMGRDPDLFAENQGVVEAILAFRPLQYLCFRGVRNVTTLHTIVEHHGATLKGLLIEPTRKGRVGRSRDYHFKYPAMTPADVRRIAESTPLLRELRLPIKRTKGDKDECAIYKAIGSFCNLRCLLLDLHYDIRTPPVDPQWRPGASQLRDILINAATDKDLAQSIWNLIARNQASKALRTLTVRPFGADVLKMPEAYLLMTVGRAFLVMRPPSDAFEPLQIRRVAEGAYELEVERRLQEGDGPRRGLTPALKQVVDGVWPGPGKWQTRWRSFPLAEEEEEETRKY
ncbi:hypothetical protein BJY00DRAFT_282161 [Aspergillus carlsbadensis]|nr:hypothetical protein BJY00DRAFT_282161 [Aspergillus carlsbadensis]